MILVSSNSSSFKKKMLGQYFTSPQLSDFLVAISDPKPGIKAIDPMCGSGNMLEALIRHGLKPEKLTGIEVDPDYSELEHPYKVYTSNAFNPELYDIIGTSYDLVITNPPYVRYQDIKGTLLKNIDNFDIKDIKKNLTAIIDKLTHNTEEERKLLKKLICDYSGLSNLAIPCWILCMALTSKNGTLSLVVPETWLSREYAQPLKKALLKMFRVRFIVLDNSPTWFEDAETKTNLIVLKRKEMWQENTNLLCQIEISKESSGVNSIIENARINGLGGDRVIEMILSDVVPETTDNIDISYYEQNDYFLKNAVLFSFIRTCTANIEKIGNIDVGIGQGLRTGGNDFFHVKLISEERSLAIVESKFDGRRFELSDDYILPLVKHISNKEKLTLNLSESSDRLLYITQPIEGDCPLKTYIKDVEITPKIVKGREILIPTLSAVRTNENGTRRWYMLPELKRRHIPDLLIPRIIDKKLCCYLNDEKMVVDANFTTIWVDEKSDWDKMAIFALLNSTWIKICAEVYGTRLSAGALKLEAVQLKKIPIPSMDRRQKQELSDLGERLKFESGAVGEIDRIIFEALCPEADVDETISAAKLKLNEYISKRGKKCTESTRRNYWILQTRRKS